MDPVHAAEDALSMAPHPPLDPPHAADTPFKGDEGYSEDARSLDDGDSTMGVEPRFPPQPVVVDPIQAVFDAVLSLDETQRTGRSST
jgi:hypothetical protein